MLPDWFNADNLQTILTGSIVGLAIVVFFVARFVRKLVVKALVIGIIVVIGTAAWFQRDQLNDCAATCECKVFGVDVTIPEADRLPQCNE